VVPRRELFVPDVDEEFFLFPVTPALAPGASVASDSALLPEAMIGKRRHRWKKECAYTVSSGKKALFLRASL